MKNVTDSIADWWNSVTEIERARILDCEDLSSEEVFALGIHGVLRRINCNRTALFRRVPSPFE
jgi:hypothetical protein